MLGGEVLVAGDAGQHGVSLRLRTCWGGDGGHTGHASEHASWNGKGDSAYSFVCLFISTRSFFFIHFIQHFFFFVSLFYANVKRETSL